MGDSKGIIVGREGAYLTNFDTTTSEKLSYNNTMENLGLSQGEDFLFFNSEDSSFLYNLSSHSFTELPGCNDVGVK